MKNILRACGRVLLALAGLCLGAPAADVVYIDLAGSPSPSYQVLKRGCLFYGLDLAPRIGLENASAGLLRAALLEQAPAAIVVTAASLADGTVARVLDELTRSAGFRPRVLVTDVRAGTEAAALRAFSAGALSSCQTLRPAGDLRRFVVADAGDVTGQLAGQSFDVELLSADALQAGPGGRLLPLIALSDPSGSRKEAVFASGDVGGRPTYFLSAFAIGGSPYLLRPGIGRGDLLGLLPYLFFLRAACGDRCWESSGHFANLVIDDPWLREPYGHLRYDRVLAEMKAANFHTTIAFVPWNYDRSQPGVVSLFARNPDRFSVCVHGDNHDHREFSTTVALREQERDMVQGLARMEEFRRRTGLPYDRVMVFPHSIGTEASLRLLKKLGFLATVNGDPVPAGSPRPADLLFYLRNPTLDYGTIASFDRADAGRVSEPAVALDLFLGNPILLYSHHDLFEPGPDAFNPQARLVNRLEPSVIWASLGTIARRFYLRRRLAGGSVEVLAFGPEIEIRNPSPVPVTFRVRKPEDPSARVRAVRLDGRPAGWGRSGDGLTVELEMPPASTGLVEIVYEEAPDLAAVDISKRSLRVRILREFSDFRDNALAASPAGRLIIGAYYDLGGRARLALLGAVLLAGALVVRRVIRRRRLRRRQAGGRGCGV
ncbi:MAG TPA: hypothetical protein P5119_05935 [Candidatus Aminicenantes bacterium]|nr:hypothetical protein [Candidatus Aminicenantes bacterium]HRY64864.1 hypothetical protein [Candidatus Aminicenantes bacterium]HRZ71777.1 hypothetical protein [Candidatus Aminicenantes bacterium]